GGVDAAPPPRATVPGIPIPPRKTGGNHGPVTAHFRARRRPGDRSRPDRLYREMAVRRGVGAPAAGEARPQPDRRRDPDRARPREAARRSSRTGAAERAHQDRAQRGHHPPRLLRRLAGGDDSGAGRQGRVREALTGTPGVTRRGLLWLAEALGNLLAAPLSLGGEWAMGAPGPALPVATRMREACLSGVRLLSDRQPRRLRVDQHGTGPPSVWLQTRDPDLAVVNIDVPAHDWPRLAYQFGHELGHVLCNSWGWGSKPRLPCQWLEESMVEALSLHGLGRLADSCEAAPLFPGDRLFPATLRKYRRFLLDRYIATGGVPAGAPI